jgi:predicted ATPase
MSRADKADENGSYEFEVEARPDTVGPNFQISYEKCTLHRGGHAEGFEVAYGVVKSPWLNDRETAITSDRLYLQAADVPHSFNPLFVRLREMRFYNFDPNTLRELHRPTTGAVLGRRGEDLGDVLGALEAERPDLKERLDAYLAAIIPGAMSIERDYAGNYITVLLRTVFGDGAGSEEFGPEAMSDGTIRAAGVLAALFQPWALSGRVPLIGIEEPELALHPAATAVLYDALTEASAHVQIVATSQSPDLLDRDETDEATIRAVMMEHGLTVIGEVDEASQRIVQDKLSTIGELMRTDQITPKNLSDDSASQPKV